MIIRQPLAGIAFLLAFNAGASEPSFEANVRQAHENAATPEGAAYDRALGATFQSSPDFEAGMIACLEKHPGDHAVEGYFHLISATEYKVVLEPSSDFSTCLARAFEGFPLPEPPAIPYFNPLSFSNQP